jgi:hypothetical protein
MRTLPSALLCLCLWMAATPVFAALSQEEMVNVLKNIDEQQRNGGDYKALAFIEQREKDKELMVYEAVIYRRDIADKLMILFLRPKAEAGKGYLRLDKNLFIYDPTVGKWERRTERERIGGTDSRRADFDESRLAEEYAPTYIGLESLGRFSVHHLKLSAKPGVDVGFPVVDLWIDVKNGNVLKAQDRALSGRLMRTVYYPKWRKIMSPSKGSEVYFPKEIHIYDEVEKANQTQIVMRKIDMNALPDNIFTKAWLEAQSR